MKPACPPDLLAHPAPCYQEAGHPSISILTQVPIHNRGVMRVAEAGHPDGSPSSSRLPTGSPIISPSTSLQPFLRAQTILASAGSRRQGPEVMHAAGVPQGSALSSPSSSMPHVSRSQLAGGQKQRLSWSDGHSDTGSYASSWTSSLPSISRTQLSSLPASGGASNRPHTVGREAFLAAEARALLMPGNPNLNPGIDTKRPNPGAATMLHQTASHQLSDQDGAQPLRSTPPVAAVAAAAPDPASLRDASAGGWPNPFAGDLWRQREGAEAPADAQGLASQHGVPAEAGVESTAEQLPPPQRSSSIPIPAVPEVGCSPRDPAGCKAWVRTLCNIA